METFSTSVPIAEEGRRWSDFSLFCIGMSQTWCLPQAPGILQDLWQCMLRAAECQQEDTHSWSLSKTNPLFQRYTAMVANRAVPALRRKLLGFPVTFHCTQVPSSAGALWAFWVPCCCSQLLSTACCQPQCTLQQGLGHSSTSLCDATGLSWAQALARTTSRTSRSRGWQHRQLAADLYFRKKLLPEALG